MPPQLEYSRFRPSEYSRFRPSEYSRFRPSEYGLTQKSVVSQSDKDLYSSLDQELRSNEQFKKIAESYSYDPEITGFLIERDGEEYWIRLFEQEGDIGRRYAPGPDLKAILAKHYGDLSAPTPLSQTADNQALTPPPANPSRNRGLMLPSPPPLQTDEFESDTESYSSLPIRPSRRRSQRQQRNAFGDRGEIGGSHRRPSNNSSLEELLRIQQEEMRSQQAEMRGLRSQLGTTNQHLAELLARLSSQAAERLSAPLDPSLVTIPNQQLLALQAEQSRLTDTIARQEAALEDLRTSSQREQQALREQNTALETRTGRLTDRIEELETIQRAQEKELAETKQEAAKLSRKLKEVRRTESEASAQVTQLNKQLAAVKNIVTQLRQDLATSQEVNRVQREELESLQTTQRQSLETINTQSGEISSLREAKTGVEGALRVKTQAAETLQERLTKIEAEQSRVARELAQSEEKYRDLQASSKGLTKELDGKKAQIQKLETQVAEASSLKQELRAANQARDEAVEGKAALQRNLKESEELLRNLQSEKKRSDERIAQLEAELNSSSAQKAALEQQNEQLQGTLTDLTHNLAEMVASAKTAEENAVQLSATTQARLEEIQREKRELEEKLKTQANASEAEIAGLESKLHLAQQRHEAEKEQLVEGSAGALAEAQSKIKSLERDLEQAKNQATTQSEKADTQIRGLEKRHEREINELREKLLGAKNEYALQLRGLELFLAKKQAAIREAKEERSQLLTLAAKEKERLVADRQEALAKRAQTVIVNGQLRDEIAYLEGRNRELHQNWLKGEVLINELKDAIQHVRKEKDAEIEILNQSLKAAQTENSKGIAERDALKRQIKELGRSHQEKIADLQANISYLNFKIQSDRDKKQSEFEDLINLMQESYRKAFASDGLSSLYSMIEDLPDRVETLTASLRRRINELESAHESTRDLLKEEKQRGVELSEKLQQERALREKAEIGEATWHDNFQQTRVFTLDLAEEMQEKLRVANDQAENLESQLRDKETTLLKLQASLEKQSKQLDAASKAKDQAEENLQTLRSSTLDATQSSHTGEQEALQERVKVAKSSLAEKALELANAQSNYQSAQGLIKTQEATIDELKRDLAKAVADTERGKSSQEQRLAEAQSDLEASRARLVEVEQKLTAAEQRVDEAGRVNSAATERFQLRESELLQEIEETKAQIDRQEKTLARYQKTVADAEVQTNFRNDSAREAAKMDLAKMQKLMAALELELFRSYEKQVELEAKLQSQSVPAAPRSVRPAPPRKQAPASAHARVAKPVQELQMQDLQVSNTASAFQRLLSALPDQTKAHLRAIWKKDSALARVKNAKLLNSKKLPPKTRAEIHSLVLLDESGNSVEPTSAIELIQKIKKVPNNLAGVLNGLDQTPRSRFLLRSHLPKAMSRFRESDEADETKASTLACYILSNYLTGTPDQRAAAAHQMLRALESDSEEQLKDLMASLFSKVPPPNLVEELLYLDLLLDFKMREFSEELPEIFRILTTSKDLSEEARSQCQKLVAQYHETDEALAKVDLFQKLVQTARAVPKGHVIPSATNLKIKRLDEITNFMNRDALFKKGILPIIRTLMDELDRM